MTLALPTRALLVAAALTTLLPACADSVADRDRARPAFPDTGAGNADFAGDSAGVDDIDEVDELAGALCPIPLTSSLELDLALATVALSGTVTFDGASIADTPGPSGGVSLGVELVDVETGAVYPTPVDAETGEYAITLFAGTYDVGLVVYGEGQYLSAYPRLGEVARGLVLAYSVTRDFDIPVANVSGTVTVNGAQMPSNERLDDVWRGQLVFENADTGAYRLVGLATGGPATYEATLVPGTYHVTLTPTVSYDTSFGVFPPVELARGPVELGDVTIADDARLDFDATTVRISGTVVGATDWMAGGADHAVRLDFYRPDTGALYFAGVDRRTGAYALALPHGEYTISLRTRRSVDDPFYFEELSYPLCDSLADAACRVDRSTALDWPWPTDASPDLGLDTFTVSGEITIDGAPMRGADSAYSRRAYVRFSPLEGGIHAWQDLGPTGPADYAIELTPGVYGVSLEAQSAWDQSALPPNGRTVLADEVELTSARALDFDVATARLTAEVLVNGGTMPDDGLVDGSPRGAVQIVDPITGWSVEQEIGEEGPAALDLWLFAGTYDVRLTGSWLSRIAQYYSQDVLPSGVGMLAEAQEITGTTVRVFDGEVIEVWGALTVDGAPAGAALDVEAVELVFVDAQHGFETAAGLTRGSYFVRLYAGDYLIELRKAPHVWQQVAPLGATRVDPACGEARL